ncbi:YuiB family protein [Ammoniphilus sp. YIM 78166]|uniref:YuiB family protein n=1 Tax=Ammoniphilus sp. YIM 78166 TaxID=1644106 RepID=UPI00106F49E9|nr:YuiB family protein [Ammoniphilus sp. YIM 78166]
MNIPQLIISIPLFLVLAFGIGFILNMLIKTTWLPLVIYALLLVYLIISMGSLLVVDYIILTSGLAGAVLSGVTIRVLRAKGYRMF